MVCISQASLKVGEVHAKKNINDAGASLDATFGKTGLPKYGTTEYLGAVGQWIFGILGLIFFVLTVYAGITWFLARGEDEKITTAKNTLIAAVLGLILTVAAYAIATFVTNAVIGS